MNGKSGKVESVQTHTRANVLLPRPIYLVTFDTPAAPWSTTQLPVKSFHFEGHELKEI